MVPVLSPKSPLGRPASLHALSRLAREGVLSAQGYHQGMTLMVRGALQPWLDRLLLWLGTAALFGGIFFFLHYNWAFLDRLGKLALPVGGILVCALSALWLGLDSAKGRFLTLLASFLTGMALFVMGRVYHLGAPTWQFVLVWAGLIVPWTLSSRWAVQWAAQTVLFGLAVHLWSIRMLMGEWQLLEVGTHTAATIYFLLVWLGWMKASVRVAWINRNWLRNMLLFLVCAPATLGAVFNIVLGPRQHLQRGELAVWAAVMLVMWISAARGRCLASGLAAILSVTAVCLVAVGKTLFEQQGLGDTAYLVFAASAIVISGVAAMLMRKLGRRWGGRPDA